MRKNVKVTIKQKGDGNEANVYIERENSFQSFIDNASIPMPITKNRFSYRNPNINFYGRQEELNMIDCFMNNKDRISLWSLTGDGGIGKSKFALYISKKYNELGWKVLWLDKNDVDKVCAKFNNYTYSTNVLFIFDYAGAYVKEIAKLVSLLFNTSSSALARLILIERASYGGDEKKRHSWYSRLKYETDVIEEIEYLPHSLDLKKYPLTHHDYRLILHDFSNGELKEYEKQNILCFVMNLTFSSTSDRNGNEHLKCLLVLFAADAYLENKDLSNWNASDLMKRVINHNEKIIEKKYSETIAENSQYILAFATASGKFNIEENIPIIGDYIKEIKKELNRISNITSIKTYLNDLCEKETEDLFVTPLVPDIVGEYMFLSTFSDLDELKQRAWIAFLFKQLHFQSFIERCISDWFNIGECQSLIGLLIKNINTEEEAYQLMNILVNASFEMNEAESILRLNKKAKVIVDKFSTDRIFKRYLSIFVNAIHETDVLTSQFGEIKNIVYLLEEHKTYEVIVEYASLLTNISAKSNNDSLKIIEEEIMDILKEYDTDEIAERYAGVLINISSNLNTVDEIERVSNKLHQQSHRTSEIALADAKILYNATCATKNYTKQCDIVKKIEELYDTYETEEIANQLLTAYVNITANSPLKDIYEFEKKAMILLEKYNTDKMLFEFIAIIVNKSSKNISAEELLTDTKRIRHYFQYHKSNDIILRYLELLLNISSELVSLDMIDELITESKSLVAEYDEETILSEYIQILVNRTSKTENPKDIEKIAEEVSSMIRLDNDDVLLENYTSILVNQSAKSNNVDEIVDISKKIFDILEKKNDNLKLAYNYLEVVANLYSIKNVSKDVCYIKKNVEDILLQHDDEKIILLYANILANETNSISSFEGILQISDTILQLYRKYKYKDILIYYAVSLANSTFETQQVDERIKIVDLLQEVLNEKYCTEIALQYAKSIVNVMDISKDYNTNHTYLSIIENELINRYDCLDIAEQYTMALTLVANLSSSTEELYNLADKGRKLFKKYQNVRIAELYATLLALILIETNTLEEKNKIVKVMENEIFFVYNSENISIIYATILVEIANHNVNEYELKIILDKIKLLKIQCRSETIIDFYYIVLDKIGKNSSNIVKKIIIKFKCAIYDLFHKKKSKK